jgi:hypothetical protein
MFQGNLIWKKEYSQKLPEGFAARKKFWNYRKKIKIMYDVKNTIFLPAFF